MIMGCILDNVAWYLGAIMRWMPKHFPALYSLVLCMYPHAWVSRRSHGVRVFLMMANCSVMRGISERMVMCRPKSFAHGADPCDVRHYDLFDTVDSYAFFSYPAIDQGGKIG